MYVASKTLYCCNANDLRKDSLSMLSGANDVQQLSMLRHKLASSLCLS